MRRPLGSIVPIIGVCAIVPVGLMLAFGEVQVHPAPWIHFYGVGGSALVATAAAVWITVVGARQKDVRTVVVGGGFALMGALLAMHGLVTPHMLIGMNGLGAVTGAVTLPLGGAIMALSALPQIGSPHAIRRIVALEAAIAATIVAFCVVGMLNPTLVPGVPAEKSPAAVALFIGGLAVYGALGVRATNTFLLTRRLADFAVVAGIVLLACSLYGALILYWADFGWWLGHIYEFVGLSVVAAALAYDLRRGRKSRALVGDLRAAELVAAEEQFLGARVRALMVRLADKDTSTEEHTRRVATLAVELGERLGLSPGRLRSLAIGGLVHDMGKLSVPTAILRKPGPLDDEELAQIKLHPERGRELLNELGGFDAGIRRLVLDHHERLDGSGYPRGLTADQMDLPTRILAVCDVYDALVSPRVYRPAWSRDDALAHLREQAGTAFDETCVKALEALVTGRTVAGREPAYARDPGLSGPAASPLPSAP
jgi:HD-GYP domain-containing protein (c-di-GMP phosphodiesterase class II)